MCGHGPILILCNTINEKATKAMELCRVMRDLIELTLSIRDSKVKMVKMVKMHQENLRKMVKVTFGKTELSKGRAMHMELNYLKLH